eukprot:gene18739-20629_t
MAACLQAACSSLQALEGIVSRSFGPNGLDIALKTESGCIIVTNSGQTILESISLSHQIGRLVLSLVKEHVKITGDNSKMFILLLTEILRGISEDALMRDQSRNITSKLSGLSAACFTLDNLLTSNVDSILKPCLITFNNGSGDKLERTIKGLARTVLQGKFSPHVVNVLVDLIVEICTHNTSSRSGLLSYVQNLLDEFSEVCIEVRGISIRNSAVRDGFIFQRDPTGRTDKQFLNDDMLKFTCLSFSFDFEKVEFAKTQFSFTEYNTRKYAQRRQLMIEKLSKKFQEQNIKVLLCKTNVPDFAMSVLASKFCILQNMDERDMARICAYFKIHPVENIEEFYQGDASIYPGKLSVARSIIIGTQKYFNIIPADPIDNQKPCCQLVLCAASSGISQQYAREIVNALKVVKMSLYGNYGRNKSSEEIITVLPGAGATEFSLSKYFGEISSKSDSDDFKLVSQSLSQALLSIPRHLHNNSNRLPDNARFINVQNKFIKVQNTLTNIVDNSHHVDVSELHGINRETGGIISPVEHDIIEPFLSKILLISHVLQAAQQVLKTDQIIPSKKTQ